MLRSPAHDKQPSKSKNRRNGTTISQHGHRSVGSNTIRLRRARIKKWGKSFMYFVIGAFYVEVVKGRDTSSFINTLVKFINRIQRYTRSHHKWLCYYFKSCCKRTRKTTKEAQWICNQRKHYLEFQPTSIFPYAWCMRKTHLQKNQCAKSSKAHFSRADNFKQCLRNWNHCQQPSIDTYYR